MLQPADAAPQAAPPQAAPDVGACARAAMPIWSSDDAEREFRAFEVGLTLAGSHVDVGVGVARLRVAVQGLQGPGLAPAVLGRRARRGGRSGGAGVGADCASAPAG
eukprot:1064143-Rhodomonas_salina.3